MRISVFLMAVLPATLAAQASDSLAQHTKRDSTRTLETVTVSAIRAPREAPIAAVVLDSAQLVSRYFGQDVPLLLQGTPSLTAYTETGNYWGYSYIRMRGIDQSRINLSVDGIPLNDPEDQVLYFADFPDLANSIASVQIQRGVGTSAPGTASYGGSINFQTVPVAAAARSAEAQLQAGSFGTQRLSAEYASGLNANGLAVYARLSALRSSGYRRHSGVDARSAFLSAAYARERDVFKIMATTGLFADTLAYVGASLAELDVNRQFNPLRPDETDRFGERLAALSYTRYLGTSSSLSTTLYRTSASGNYYVCIDDPAVCANHTARPVTWDFHLDFTWYGLTTVWTMEGARARMSAGVNANTYARNHYAYDVAAATAPLYSNTGRKRDASVFAKTAYDIGPFTLFSDIQARRAELDYVPDANANMPQTSVSWTFVNPKIGATWRLSPALTSYASFGINSREPARSDILGGLDDVDAGSVSQVLPFTRVRPERAHDSEAGVRYRAATWRVDANLFDMEFRNEILPIGELTYIGTPLRKNVARSWRRGVEADLTWDPLARASFGVTTTLMQARIPEYLDDATGQVHRDVEPLLTPRILTSQHARVQLSRGVAVTLAGRYFGRAQLDNTGSSTLTLPAYFIADASAEWTLRHVVMRAFLNNATDAHRFGSGHVSGGVAKYYVLPPRNIFVEVKLGL